MYRITVAAVGALKEPFWKDAIAEYEKRLKPFAKVSVIEVAEKAFKSATEAEAVLREEGDRLRARIPLQAFTLALDKGGRALTTEKFAELLKREGEGGRELVFVIGGPLGLDPKLVAASHAALSLSSLTFTHGEARAVLFEQLYRAMTVLAGKTYHY
jgi:23S rRNA (pseudouridine1915-N3)-methyltransferase